ncbi:hypothetical protein BASA83_013673 [Batrachochytrium salamandrivorans]|nr:hypothetical protein BASA83_013673 [Batrachochytrium salamandrivorans]
MANLEEIVASLTDRLRSLEIENQALQQEIRTRKHFRGFINQLELVFQLQISGTIRQEEMLPSAPYFTDKALVLVQPVHRRPRAYSGLSSEIKDHLVHASHRVSLAAAMDQAIRIDNRIFERRQEQQYNPRSFRRNQPLNTEFSNPTSAVPAAIHE